MGVSECVCVCVCARARVCVRVRVRFNARRVTHACDPPVALLSRNCSNEGRLLEVFIRPLCSRTPAPTPVNGAGRQWSASPQRSTSKHCNLRAIDSISKTQQLQCRNAEPSAVHSSDRQEHDARIAGARHRRACQSERARFKYSRTRDQLVPWPPDGLAISLGSCTPRRLCELMQYSNSIALEPHR